MLNKKSYYACLLFLCINQVIFSQNIFQNNKFTSIPIFDGTVVLLKEITLNQSNPDNSFSSLKNWGKVNFGNDPLISSIKIRSKDKIIYCKSKVELLLPENKMNVREKVIMSYKLDAFIVNNKCILEIKDINYKINNYESLNLPKSSFTAEEIVSDNAIINDRLSELQQNTRISTLYFFNNLADNLSLNINL